MSLKKRLLAGLLIVAVCVSAALLLTQRSRPTLMYQGKSVEDWSMQLYLSQDQGARDAASAALKTLGPKAVPDVMRMLRNKDPFIRRQAWLFAPKVPLRLRKEILANVKPLRAGLYHM